MLKGFLIFLGAITLVICSTDSLPGQDTKELLGTGDFYDRLKDISHVVVKAGKKMYDFEMDTSGVGYRSILQINPNLIESIDILKNKALEGGTKTYLILNLKRRAINKLPADIRSKFY